MQADVEILILRDKVESALDVCRPFLHADGGDVEIVAIRDGGVVELKFHGTCARCSMSGMTLRAGIERAILRAAPEVRRVESIS